jgi:hypothetical protein
MTLAQPVVDFELYDDWHVDLSTFAETTLFILEQLVLTRMFDSDASVLLVYPPVT